MDLTGPEMAPVVAAVGRLQGGDVAGGRAALLALWGALSADDQAMQRCVIAHFLADTETDVAAELAWDRLALEAATSGADATDAAFATFLPSLHLNVGDALRRSGDTAGALSHAEAGLALADALADEGYGAMTRSALSRLHARATAGDASGAPPVG